MFQDSLKSWKYESGGPSECVLCIHKFFPFIMYVQKNYIIIENCSIIVIGPINNNVAVVPTKEYEEARQEGTCI